MVEKKADTERWNLVFVIWTFTYEYSEYRTEKKDPSPQVYDVGGDWKYRDDVCGPDKCLYR